MITQLKVIIVGDSSVGKTTLLKKYIDHEFAEDLKPTLGLQFYSKTVEINQRKVSLQLWDTAGQEKYNSLIKNFYYNSNCVFILYSISDKKSFKHVLQWKKQAQEFISNDCLFVLVGTKKDLEKMRVVSFKEGKDMAYKQGFDIFMETSAKKDY